MTNVCLYVEINDAANIFTYTLAYTGFDKLYLLLTHVGLYYLQIRYQTDLLHESVDAGSHFALGCCLVSRLR